MTIAQILADFGAYYIQNKANRDRLVKLLYFKTSTMTAFSSVITDDTVYRAAQSSIDRLLQPFQKKWTPVGTVSFKPISIEQHHMKIDFEDYPHTLEASWLGFLADHGKPADEWPFIRWFMEEHMLPKAKEELELNEVYKGVYQAPNEGVAGASGTLMDGIEKKIKGYIQEGRIVPIALGALPSDPVDMVDYIEEFADSMSERYWGVPMDLNMSLKAERKFGRGYVKKYGTKVTYKDNDRATVDLSMLRIVGRASMIGKDRIWCTPLDNAKYVQKKSIDEIPFEIEKIDRLVKIFTDLWLGLGFLIPECVFTNDVD